MQRISFWIICCILLSCKSLPNMKQDVEIQGHRGCRGLMPENTIDGFLTALDMGVNTLEMDVVISADGQIVVSHEAYFSHEITTTPSGDTLDIHNEKSFNLFKMSYDSIRKFDVGVKIHPRFPLQKKVAAYKPTLEEVITQCEIHCKKIGRDLPNYNIEIKTQNNEGEAYNPDDIAFVNIVLKKVIEKNILERTTIQSFDHDIIKSCHSLYAQAKLVLLVEDTIPALMHLTTIGFTPYAYSPYYKLVNKDLVELCHQKQMKLIPWTVNDAVEVENLIKLGVDGIITDYPDMAIEVRTSFQNVLEK